MALLAVAVALVCLSSAEGMAPPEEVHDLHGERPTPGIAGKGPVLTRERFAGAQRELGEAKAGKVAATVGVPAMADPTKQNTLKVIEKLMEAPIIDPRQEKAFKAAALKVENVKQHIKHDLMEVVKMEILSQRVSELDAKKAMGLAANADKWLMSSEQAMDGAVEASAGHTQQRPFPPSHQRLTNSCPLVGNLSPGVCCSRTWCSPTILL